MLHLQCTKKILKIVGETKGGPVPLRPTLLSWHVNEFRAARRKLLLFTNDLTYYSVFWYPATKPHILNMKNVLASELMEALLAAGFKPDHVEKYFTGFDHAIITPTSSRRVSGVMNDLKGQIMFLMSDYYEEPLSSREIIKRLNKTPYSIPGHKTCYPVEAFAERVTRGTRC
ncbi:MAG: hypothetical protein JXB42_00290 [Deltaproteobacteria bacterium]|nr:hypothetical protein [Deltaproteobacteria bacterium]